MALCTPIIVGAGLPREEAGTVNAKANVVNAPLQGVRRHLTRPGQS
jgi:hypothetical protein